MTNLSHTCVDDNHAPCAACDSRPPYVAPLMPDEVYERSTWNSEAAWEAGKLTCAIIGAAGYAALIAAAHITMAAFSLAIFGACWYGVYRMMR